MKVQVSYKFSFSPLFIIYEFGKTCFICYIKKRNHIKEEIPYPTTLDGETSHHIVNLYLYLIME